MNNTMIVDMLNSMPESKSFWSSSDGDVLVRRASLDDGVLRILGCVEPSKFRTACTLYFENLHEPIPTTLPLQPSKVYVDRHADDWVLVGEYDLAGGSS